MRETFDLERALIEFKTRTLDGKWETANVLLADPSGLSHVEQTAEKYEREGFYLFDRDGRRLDPKTLFAGIKEKGNIVLMIPRPRPPLPRPSLRKN